METKCAAITMLMAISFCASAEDIKTGKIKTFECDNVNVIDLKVGGDRLPPQGKGYKYTFHIGKYKNTEADKFEINIDESRRKTHIQDDVAQVVDLLKGKTGVVATQELPLIEPEREQCISYSSAYDRSTIAVQVKNGAKPDDAILINRSLIAGPEENWSLSADLPVNNVKQLTYDPKTSSVIPKDKPTSFYVGLNYKLGDVYTEYGYLDWHNFSGKFLFKASSSPNESMGLGIGYSFSFVDVFVARMWTRDDVNTGNATLGTTKSNIYGVSFNISKGISWLKSN